MAKKKDTVAVLSNTKRGIGYYDWFFLRSGKGAKYAEKYKALKASGLVSETDTGTPFVEPRADNTYFGTSLFPNKRAQLNLKIYG